MPPRPRRRAVGPPGAAVPAEPPVGLGSPERRAAEQDEPPAPDDDARLLADRPPHHDRGV